MVGVALGMPLMAQDLEAPLSALLPCVTQRGISVRTMIYYVIAAILRNKLCDHHVFECTMK